jgi:transcriptional regulator with XRE-family HTH domain
MPTLGQELSRLRRLKGWTLRDVEDQTKRKVSNSYLYQLESDNVKEPSPHILYELSVVYGASYPGLLELAGFVVPASSPQASHNSASVAFSALDLTDEEREDVMDFIEFRRRKRKRSDENAT